MLFGHFIKLIADYDKISVEYRVLLDKEYETRIQELSHFVKICLENKEKTSQKHEESFYYEYLKSQLQLFGLLSMNRNYACVKNLQELLPEQTLLKYVN